MRSLGVMIRKELRRVFTDRRLVVTVLLLPGLSIAVIYSVMGMAIGNMEDDRSDHQFQVLAQGMPAAVESYMEAMPSQRIDLEAVTGDLTLDAAKEKVRAGEVDLLVLFDENFDRDVTDYQDAPIPNVDTYYNPLSDFSQDAYSYFVHAVMEPYRWDVLGERLGSMAYTQVYTFNKDNTEISVASEEKVATRVISGILPVLISIFLFAGAMGIGVDMVAGEKERGTMATILLTPIRHETIAMGKVVSLGIVAVFATCSSIGGILLSFPFSSRIFGGEVALEQLSIAPLHLLLMLITLLALDGLYVTLIVLVSVFSKTVKEAGSYIAPVYMLVLISSVLSMLRGNTGPFFSFLIPVYGNNLVLKDLIGGELNLTAYGLNLLVTVTLVALLVALIRRLFRSEKLMIR